MASPGSVVVQFLVDAAKAAGDAAKFATSLGKVDTEATDLDSTLDALETELDSIGRASADIAADMTRAGTGFDSVGDDAEDAARRVRLAAQGMADGVHDGADDIDHETDGITGSMKEAGSEAGAEFIGNVAEGIGSGTANVTEVVQGTLGGLTNLAASLGGPVGLAAGVAAAGIGLVFAAVKGEAEKAKAKIDELRGALEDVGDLAGEEAKKAIFKTWLTSAQETTGKIEAVDGALRDAGVSAGDFHDALAGDPAAIERVRRGLQLQGSEIIKNKEQTGKITDEQQKYLDTFPDILHDIGASDKALGAVRREHEAIENLSGDTAKNADKTADNLDTAAGKAGKLADEMDDAARDRTISIRFKYPGGRIPGFGLPNRPGSVTVTVPKAAAMTSTYAAPPQVQAAPPVIVTEEQIYRAVSRLLMRGEARNGRRVVWG